MIRMIDAHVHAFGRGTRSIRDLLNIQKRYGYAASNYLSCECFHDAAQNALGIYLKALVPENYAFGGLHYRYIYDYAHESRALIELGFDGMKMVENKPNVRKLLNMPQNHPDYDEYYGYLEETGIPLLAHVADPEECWDIEKIPRWCYAAGCYYGGGDYEKKETLYAETFDVLNRFPSLKIILAHWFFMSADLPRMHWLMESYKSVHLDLVSGTEMYWNFAEDTEGWRDFFIKYQNRIIYGTDNVNVYEEEEIGNMNITNDLQIKFLTTEGPIPAWDKFAYGINLPRHVQEKIFGGNFARLCGGAPKVLNLPKAAQYLSARLSDCKLRLTPEERKTIAEVLAFLESIAVSL